MCRARIVYRHNYVIIYYVTLLRYLRSASQLDTKNTQKSVNIKCYSTLLCYLLLTTRSLALKNTQKSINIIIKLQMQQQSICCKCVYCLHVYKRFLQVPKYNKSKNNSYLYLKQILKLKASLKCKLNGMAIKRRQCQNKKFCVGQQPLNSTSFTNVNNNSSKVKKQAYIDNMNNIQTTIIICKSNKLSLLEKEFNDYITVDPRQSQQYLGRRFFKPFGPINSIG
eukprot:TRINITY_DN1852_c0_g1_i15.p2 TRINITY_DN1852_c0_g1~~TRINITY_DN1852_c0_g1_i15.p2  ORF type:complete len:224 (+),score=-7.65 TRINITY_DN1852_c0_g1_i15:615-1286(+)